MYSVILSDAAQTDLDNIIQHIAVHNPTAAEKLGLELIDVAMSLQTFPHRGSRVDHLNVAPEGRRRPVPRRRPAPNW
jgi:plasmid stabilization system protein ParE